MYLPGKQLPRWGRPGLCIPTKIFFEVLTLVWHSFFSLLLILKTMIAVAGSALFWSDDVHYYDQMMAGGAGRVAAMRAGAAAVQLSVPVVYLLIQRRLCFSFKFLVT